MPTKPPTLSRSSRRDYAKAIDDAGERAARLRGDPKAIEREAREKAFEDIERRAATMPTQKQTKYVEFMKRGVHR
jgi:hypothetical protein